MIALLGFISISVLMVIFQPEPEANVNQPIPVVVDAMKLKVQNI